MYNLTNLPNDDLNAVIGNTAKVKKVSRAIVEKDLWVCTVLDYLFTKSPWKNNLAFKGGTSLSKAYNLIERFSEDIDLILDWQVLGYKTKEPLAERSATRQDKLNKEILEKTAEFLNDVFLPKIQEDLGELINKPLSFSFADDAVNINYRNNYDDESILHIIRLEIGALAAWTPTEEVIIRPYIAEVYPDQFGDAKVAVRTTTPERTFWEKATILHRESHRTSGVPARMSRHYYDVYQMSELGILDKALADPGLLDRVAAFKSKFYPQKWAEYETAQIGTLKLTPAENSLADLRKDYNQMAGMIYGEQPDFDDLIAAIKDIEHKING